MFIPSVHKLRSNPREHAEDFPRCFKSSPFTSTRSLHFTSLQSVHVLRSRLNWTNKQITNKFDFVTRARNFRSIFSYGNWIFFLHPNPKTLISILATPKSRRRRLNGRKSCLTYPSRQKFTRSQVCAWFCRFDWAKLIINWMGIRCCVKTILMIPWATNLIQSLEIQ